MARLTIAPSTAWRSSVELIACPTSLRASTSDVARAINQFEQAVHDRCPEVRWLFVEPDIEA